MKKRKNGYALLITMIITFFIASVALTMFSFVYRYTGAIARDKVELQEVVR